MKATAVVVVSADGVAYGVGQTSEQAWSDARAWVDRDSDGQPNLRGLCEAPCTHAYAEHLCRNGVVGPSVECVVGGVYCLRSEAFDVQAGVVS